jgi:hypothetical protein
MYGLCRHESPAFGKDKKSWTPPSEREKERNRESMFRLANGTVETRSQRIDVNNNIHNIGPIQLLIASLSAIVALCVGVVFAIVGFEFLTVVASSKIFVHLLLNST